MQEPINSSFYNQDWYTNNPFWIYGNDEKGKRRSEGVAPYLTLDTFNAWDKAILDCAAGVGWLTKFLKEYGANVIGIDYSQYSVDNRVSDRIMLGDITELPFKENMFDLIINRESFEHLTLEQCNKAFNEMIRVCKVGGHIYMTIWLETKQDAKDDIIYNDFEHDKSHITVCTRKFWENWFKPYLESGIIIRDEQKEISLDWRRKGRVWVFKKS